MKKLSVALISLSIFFVMGAVLVLAQLESDLNPAPTGSDSNTGVNIKLQNPFACGSNCTIFTLLRMIIDNIILPIGGVLAVLAFIYSGFLYVTAQGNETKLATAHRALLYTAIGTAVLLGSWAIAKVIENTINQLR